MTVKRICLLVVVLAALLCLCACTQNDTQPTEPAATASVAATTALPNSLSMRITWPDYSGRGEAIRRIVNEYNIGNTASINLLGGDESQSAIQSLLDSNAPILYVLPYRYVQYFGTMGYLLDLTDSFQSEKTAFYPQVWNLGCIGGTVYGVPWLGHSMCLLYNKTLLQNAVVDAASIRSRNALVDALVQVEQITAAKGFGLVGADGNDISWMVNQFLYGFGARLVSDDGKTVAVNSEQSRAALNFYRNVLGGHAQPSWLSDSGTEVMDCFRRQEVAFEIQGIWGVTDIQKNGSPFEVGILSMADVGLCSEVGPMMLAIPVSMGETEVRQALALIRYLISPKAQEKILLGEYSPEHDAYYPFRTPIRNDMSDSEFLRANPNFIKFIEGFQNPSIDVPVPAWQVIKTNYYGPGLHKVMTGDMTVDDFLALIEAEGNRILGGSGPSAH